MKQRKMMITIFAAACLVQTACVYVSTDGEGPFDGGEVVTRTSRPVDFNAVAISGRFASVDIDVCGDCEPLVTIRGNETLVSEVTIDVDNGVLELDQRPQLVVSGNHPQVRIEVNDLRQITLASNADVRAEPIASDVFEVISTGSGDIDLTGEVGVLDLTVAASGEVAAFNLTADTVEITSSGSGDVQVCARDLLRGQLTGSGDLFYDCAPADVDVDRTGSGRPSVR